MSKFKKLAIGLAATTAMALPATAVAADNTDNAPREAAPAAETTGGETQGDKCWFGFPFQWLCFEIDPPNCIPGMICPVRAGDAE